MHNFNETGFQIGIASLLKVVTSSKRRARPKLVQAGNWKWVIAIASICAAGYLISPFLILKGKVHLSAWYKEVDIPRN